MPPFCKSPTQDAETTYFNESAKQAKQLVDQVLQQYRDVLDKLDDDEVRSCWGNVYGSALCGCTLLACMLCGCTLLAHACCVVHVSMLCVVQWTVYHTAHHTVHTLHTTNTIVTAW